MSLHQKMLGFAALILVFTSAVVVFAIIERSAMQQRNDAQRLQVLLHTAEEQKTLFLFRRNLDCSQQFEASIGSFFITLYQYRNEPQGRLLAREMTAYLTAFRPIIPQMVERGLNENFGAEGELRHSVHEIETIVRETGSITLQVHLLSARRSEKDFFLRGDNLYIDKVRQAMMSFKDELQRSPLPATQQQRIRVLVNEYTVNVQRAADLLSKIRSHDQEMRQHFDVMVAVIENMVTEKSHHADMTERRMMGSLGLSFLFSIGLAFWIANKVSKPILELKDAAHEVAVGFYANEIRIHSGDEIAELASTFNFMVRQVRNRTDELQQTNVELRDANRHIQRQNKILSEQASEIELYNTELQEKNERLKELNGEKNELLGIVAHDLKNPLSGIKMLAKILHDEQSNLSSSEILEMTQDIQNSSTRMFELISHLLDVNAIESGAMIMVNIISFNISELVAGVVEEYQNQAKAKDIQLHIVTSHEEQLTLADPAVTRQVLENLISNAIKYSPSNKNVWVCIIRDMKWNKITSEKADLQDAMEAQGLSPIVRIEVRDEGPGLTDEDKLKLFSKFTRLSARPTAGEHSTGLGLSIVKTMVEKMGGRVWCESAYGKGATFIVELQTKPHAPPHKIRNE